METKICKKWGEEKSIDQFTKDKKKCLQCNREYTKQYRSKNKDKIKGYNKKYQTDNKEQISESQKKYRNENKEKISQRGKKYYLENIDKIKEYKKQYLLDNKDKIADKKKQIYIENKEQKLTYNRQYYIKNRDEILEQKQQYYYENKEKITEYKRSYYNNLYKTDPIYRLRKTVSRSINRYLKNNDSSKDGESCLEYLPYTIEELKLHLESLFEPWMTWDNHGNYDPKTWIDGDESTYIWQIDHIKPHSEFHYTSMEDESFKECWALSNLRPLSAKQNVKEGNRRGENKCQ